MERRNNGQGQLVKRGETWSLILRNGKNRKWYSLSTSDETEAREKAKALIEKLKSQPVESAKAQALGISLEEVWRRFETKSHCCEKNRVGYTSAWNRFLKVLKPLGIEDTLHLRPAHIEAYVKLLGSVKIQGRRLCAWTVKRKVRDLRRILSVSGADVGIFNGVELPDACGGRGREAFTDEELLAIQKVFQDERFKCPHKKEMESAHLIGLNTGLRMKDVCLLEWSSVDFAKGVLTLVPHKTRRYNRSISIPIHGDLELALRKAEAWRREEVNYVLPDMALRYLKNQTGIVQSYIDILQAASIKTSDSDGEHHFRKNVISNFCRNGIFQITACDIKLTE